MKVIRKEDKKSNVYIKKFETDDDQLVVHMADGTKPRYLNIPENKEKLLTERYNQFLNNEEKLKELKENKYVYGGVAIIFIALGTIFGTSFISLKDIADLIISSSFTTFAVLGGIKAFIANNKIKDIKKYEFFFDNEEVLDTANLDDPNTLEKVNSKDKKTIRSLRIAKDKNGDKKYFDNNSIDNLSLETLRRISDNIKRDNYLALLTSKKDQDEPCEERVYKK